MTKFSKIIILLGIVSAVPGIITQIVYPYAIAEFQLYDLLYWLNLLHMDILTFSGGPFAAIFNLVGSIWVWKGAKSTIMKICLIFSWTVSLATLAYCLLAVMWGGGIYVIPGIILGLIAAVIAGWIVGSRKGAGNYIESP